MVTKEWLCSPVPSTSSSLPHTHTATGNKTVTYDFAPIISQEGCLDFPLEQRKEAKTINVSLVQSWAWAPLGLRSASPPSLWNILYLPNSSAPNVKVTLGLFLAPLTVRGGREQRGAPKGFSSSNPTASVGQSWSIFSQCNNVLLWNPKVLKKCFNFCQIDPSSWFLEAEPSCFDCRAQWVQILPRGISLSRQSVPWVSSHRAGESSWGGKSVGAEGAGAAGHMAGLCSVLWKDSCLSTLCNTRHCPGKRRCALCNAQ